LLQVSGFSLEHNRLPEGEAKESVLRAVVQARTALPLAGILRILRLSPPRYHRWTRAEPECGLDDRSSCPRTSPAQLTFEEISTIKEMLTSNDYRHMPMTTLARYAQRIGKVFASASTWSKLARERGWRRPRTRLYPVKAKIGVRATRPNEYWHVDVTVIRLITGVRVYLHAVIDNFSRRILAWRLAERLDPTATCELLLEAGRASLQGWPNPRYVMAMTVRLLDVTSEDLPFIEAWLRADHVRRFCGEPDENGRLLREPPAGPGVRRRRERAVRPHGARSTDGSSLRAT